MQNRGLIIGEFKVSRKILKTLLRHLGYTEIDDIEYDPYYIECADYSGYSFIVADMGLGAGNIMLYVLSKVKEKLTFSIPIIAFTNQLEGEIFNKALIAGANACLSKIAPLELLKKELNKLVQPSISNLTANTKENVYEQTSLSGV